jgi:DNA-binding Xre family transcriptional regulator
MTIGVAPNAISAMARRESARLFLIDCICTALDMKVSEFFALSEG